MAPSAPKQLCELLVSPSLARWSMGPRGRNGGWAMSYRCPQPTAHSGRERRKAQVDRRFQAIRATGLIERPRSAFRSMRTLAHGRPPEGALIHQMKTETSTGKPPYSISPYLGRCCRCGPPSLNRQARTAHSTFVTVTFQYLHGPRRHPPPHPWGEAGERQLGLRGRPRSHPIAHVLRCDRYIGRPLSRLVNVSVAKPTK